MTLTGGTHGALTVRIWGLIDEYFETHDLAVEFVSPSDRLADVHVKIAGYFRAGSRLVWLFGSRNPNRPRYSQHVEVVGTEEDLEGGGVLPGFRCAVRRLFGSVPSEQ